MNVYRLSRHDPTEGVLYEWYPTERDAKRQRMVWLHEGIISARKEADVDLVIIPTSKPELIKWLNFNLDGQPHNS